MRHQPAVLEFNSKLLHLAGLSLGRYFGNDKAASPLVRLSSIEWEK